MSLPALCKATVLLLQMNFLLCPDQLVCLGETENSLNAALSPPPRPQVLREGSGKRTTRKTGMVDGPGDLIRG